MLSLSERYVVALNFLLVSIVAYFAAVSVNDILARRFATDTVLPAHLQASAPLRPASHPREFYSAIVERDLFNATRAEAPIAPAPMVSIDLHVRLLGTSQLTLSRPFAILEDEGNREQSLYQLGDDIPNAGKLVSVEKNRVIINHGGQNVALEIPRDLAPSPFSPMPGAPTRPLGGEGIRRTSENQYVVERRVVDQTMQNMAALFTQMRAIPNLENGKAVGFRLSEIQPGSLFQQMGLMDGDIVKSIGGMEMNDPSKAIELLNMMRNRSQVSIDLTRGGRPMQLTFDIR